MQNIEHKTKIAIREESQALQVLNDACASAFQQLSSEGVGSAEMVHRLNECVAPLRAEYEHKKWARLTAERDRKMLNRGTRRGVAIVLGIVSLLWGAGALVEAITNKSGGYVPIVSRGRDPEGIGERWADAKEYRRERIAMTCFAFAFSAGLFWWARSLRRIPALGNEDK